MHHVREAVDAHELLHTDRSPARDAADVVAREIDEHHMLGALLSMAQRGLVRRVLGVIGAARPRARDRMHHDLPPRRANGSGDAPNSVAAEGSRRNI